MIEVSKKWFTSNRYPVRFVDDNYIFILVQHASVEMFGQHVGVNVLKLLTESFQLCGPSLQWGQLRFCCPCLRLLLLDLPGQIYRPQPWFLPPVSVWSVFGGLTPARGRSCPRTRLAACPCFNPTAE